MDIGILSYFVDELEKSAARPSLKFLRMLGKDIEIAPVAGKAVGSGLSRSERSSRSLLSTDWGHDPDRGLFKKIRRMVGHHYPAAADLPENAASAQMLAEATNNLAKEVSENFYQWKPKAWALARRMGAGGGWSPGGTHSLYTPEVGVSAAHDPYGEISSHLPNEDVWPFHWSGVKRQHLAETLIEDPLQRRIMRDKTTPDPLAMAPYFHHGGQRIHPSQLRKELGIKVTGP